MLVAVLFASADDQKPQTPAKSSPPPLGQPAPVSLAEATKRMKLPEGFSATLFAGEPDVRQPIALAIDDRGRLWVAECYSYPNWKPEGRDRIVIFEDTDGDGRHDRRKVFWDRGNYLTGLELGFGGVYVCCCPHLLFIPDKNGDDVPDGPPQVLLDGWSKEGVHNVLNGLTWGPDGWLYGCNGITAPSKVGRPGAPPEKRLDIACGIWRYHPTRHDFEVVCHGTTNPWGLDFNDVGEAFFTNCVIGHLWHMVPGAHYKRMFGQDYNPHVYDLIEACSDHLHWGGGDWTSSRGGKGIHSAPGGGHAHSGCMVYLGDNWPDRYRNTVFQCNIHGNRVNNDVLAREGSGYVGKHGQDFLLANDEWFRGLHLTYGPDGAVYVLDWSDTGECHEKDAHGAHHDSGRIYKISYGKPRPAAKVDVAKLTDDELVGLQLHKNDWYVRHARRQLQEREAAGKNMLSACVRLHDMYEKQTSVDRRLRALWALHVTEGSNEDFLTEQLGAVDDNLRAWAIRLLCDDPGRKASEAAVKKFLKMAREDKSPLVRLYLASALQRLPLAERWELAAALVAHGEDAADHNLPLMIWYGIEPLVPADPRRAVTLATQCKIPLVRQFIARRVVSK
jgi:putative membrane-bound dehydrogenase-like protein